MTTTTRIKHWTAVVIVKHKFAAYGYQAKCSFCGLMGHPEELIDDAQANAEYHAMLFTPAPGETR